MSPPSTSTSSPSGVFVAFYFFSFHLLLRKLRRTTPTEWKGKDEEDSQDENGDQTEVGRRRDSDALLPDPLPPAGSLLALRATKEEETP